MKLFDIAYCIVVLVALHHCHVSADIDDDFYRYQDDGLISAQARGVKKVTKAAGDNANNRGEAKNTQGTTPAQVQPNVEGVKNQGTSGANSKPTATLSKGKVVSAVHSPTTTTSTVGPEAVMTPRSEPANYTDSDEEEDRSWRDSAVEGVSHVTGTIVNGAIEAKNTALRGASCVKNMIANQVPELCTSLVSGASYVGNTVVEGATKLTSSIMTISC